MAATEALSWVMWRHDLIVRWRSLEGDEAWALRAVSGGASFAEMCEGLCDWHEADAVPLRAAGILRGSYVGLGSELYPSLSSALKDHAPAGKVTQQPEKKTFLR